MHDIIENNRLFSLNKKISKVFGKKLGRYHNFIEEDKKEKIMYSSEFFGVDPSFPADQLMTRHSNEGGRNIYFVSDCLKQIVTSNQDRIKVFLLFVFFINKFLFSSLSIWVFVYLFELIYVMIKINVH